MKPIIGKEFMDDLHQLAFEMGEPSEGGEGYWFTCENFEEFMHAAFKAAKIQGTL